jgi:hypothetical protein
VAWREAIDHKYNFLLVHMTNLHISIPGSISNHSHCDYRCPCHLSGKELRRIGRSFEEIQKTGGGRIAKTCCLVGIHVGGCIRRSASGFKAPVPAAAVHFGVTYCSVDRPFHIACHLIGRKIFADRAFLLDFQFVSAFDVPGDTDSCENPARVATIVNGSAPC